MNSLGTAVVRAFDGGLISSSGELSGDEVKSTIDCLYSIFLDSMKCLEKNEPFHRISVTYSTHSFVLTLGESSGDKFLYIIKTDQQQ